MITSEQLSKWMKLAEMATEGPWKVDDFDDGSPREVVDENGWYIGMTTELENAELFAMAREAVPALIREVLRLKRNEALIIEQRSEIARLNQEKDDIVRQAEKIDDRFVEMKKDRDDWREHAKSLKMGAWVGNIK